MPYLSLYFNRSLIQMMWKLMTGEMGWKTIAWTDMVDHDIVVRNGWIKRCLKFEIVMSWKTCLLRSGEPGYGSLLVNIFHILHFCDYRFLMCFHVIIDFWCTHCLMCIMYKCHVSVCTLIDVYFKWCLKVDVVMCWMTIAWSVVVDQDMVVS